MNNYASISIVIPTFGRGNDAMVLARACLRESSNTEVIIVEQGIKKIGTAHSKKIRVFHQENPNLPAARNRGVRAARAPLILFLDDDVTITKGAIEAHIQAYHKDTHVGGVAGRALNEDDPTDMAISPVGQTNRAATVFHQNFFSTAQQYVQFVYGCNMSFKKSALEKVGYFDEKFPPLFEEIDLSMRVSKYFLLLFEPKAMVFHHKKRSGGTRNISDQIYPMYYRAYGRYVRKHVPPYLLAYTLPVVMARALRETGIAGVNAFIKGFMQHI